MNCLEFRRAIGTDPRHLDSTADAHRAQCPRCAQALQRALSFERTLAASIAVPLPEGLADRILLAQLTSSRHPASTYRWPVRSLAAALVLGFAVAATMGWRWWRAEAPLSDLAVAHLAHEPFALTARETIADSEVRSLFSELGTPLRQSPGLVQYLMRCGLAGHDVAHLVLRRDSGPVTALFVPGVHEPRRDFRRAAVRGREEPIAGGTLVLLAANDVEFEAIAAQFRVAVAPADAGALGAP